MNTIKVVGIGTEGSDILEEFSKITCIGVETVSITTFNFELNRIKANINMQKYRKPELDGESLQNSEEIAIKSQDEIFAALNGAELVIIVAMLGEYDGGGIAPVVARVAKEIGATVVSVAVMPSSFEGIHRKKNSLQSLETLINETDYLFRFDKDFILKLYSPKTLMLDALKLIHRVLAEDINRISNAYSLLKAENKI